MEILTTRGYALNRWDKDSIRPGPVGSVGDVNLQVKLKKSANYLPNRYSKVWSGANEVWSGSNVSDGQWTGYTSGGRGAFTVSQPLGHREGFKTAVGLVIENVVPVDRSRIAKTVPLGQYSWESQTARIYKSKVTGEQFLPLPNGYNKTTLPRGSQFPIIVAESSGTGGALPAADVPITDPVFGEVGSIEDDPGVGIPTTGGQVGGCRPQDIAANKGSYYTPRMGDKEARAKAPPADYPYRAAYDPLGKGYYTDAAWWPEIGTPSHIGIPGRVFGWRAVENLDKITFHPCGSISAPKGIFDFPDAPDRSRQRRPREGDRRKDKPVEIKRQRMR
ncbi:MAG: hypothetical protein ACRC6O_08675 [Flavobacterium sp.]